MKLKYLYASLYTSLIPPPPPSMHKLPKEEREAIYDYISTRAKETHRILKENAEEDVRFWRRTAYLVIWICTVTWIVLLLILWPSDGVNANYTN